MHEVCSYTSGAVDGRRESADISNSDGFPEPHDNNQLPFEEVRPRGVTG